MCVICHCICARARQQRVQDNIMSRNAHQKGGLVRTFFQPNFEHVGQTERAVQLYLDPEPQSLKSKP